MSQDEWIAEAKALLFGLLLDYESSGYRPIELPDTQIRAFLNSAEEIEGETK